MKVSRQNISENYNITSDWVSDFAKKMEKNADFLSNVKGVFQKRNAPKTIEEKMADIRERVGYGLVKSNDNDSLKNVKEAAGLSSDICECCSESCSICTNKQADYSSNFADQERVECIRLMSQLLDYIKDFLKDRTELSSSAVLDHCRRHPQLSWNILSPKMDHDKLNDFINSQIKNRSCNKELVKYISHDTTGSEPEDTTPEFMRGPSL